MSGEKSEETENHSASQQHGVVPAGLGGAAVSSGGLPSSPEG